MTQLTFIGLVLLGLYMLINLISVPELIEISKIYQIICAKSPFTLYVDETKSRLYFDYGIYISYYKENESIIINSNQRYYNALKIFFPFHFYYVAKIKKVFKKTLIHQSEATPPVNNCEWAFNYDGKILYSFIRPRPYITNFKFLK